ncbi:MAG: hypothetical protein Q9162_002762 [Coniocarpon cinnabarinum]
MRPYRAPYRCWQCTARLLHTSSAQAANPVPHPPAPGPPPKPPNANPAFVDDRVARKRKQAEQLRLGRQLEATPTKPGVSLQKRFWKDVVVHDTEDGYQIHLDSRPVRTATKSVLAVPRSKPQLATAIAHEWDSLVSAQQALKQHYIPLTSLASRAIDVESGDRSGDTSIRDSIIQMVMGYLRTDTLLCWAPEKNLHDPSQNTSANMDERAPGSASSAETLRSRQISVAQPIIAHLTMHIWPGVELNPVLESSNIMPTPQPEMTQQIVQGWVSGLPAYELAGLERGVLASKSMCIGARLLTQWSPHFGVADGSEVDKREFGIEEAAEASSLEVSWQTQMWGEVEDTHDVDKEDLRRQLGSVIILVHTHS